MQRLNTVQLAGTQSPEKLFLEDFELNLNKRGDNQIKVDVKDNEIVGGIIQYAENGFNS